MRLFRFLLIIGFFTIFVTPVLAQEEEQPVLPDIAPREFEIRGQLEISFPSLQRQPLIGFNPPPRVIDVPAGRRPFVEADQNAGMGLSVSSLKPPEAPPFTGLSNRPPVEAEFQAAAGRYLSRTLNGRIGVPLSRISGIYGEFDYRGSDGHWPSERDDDLRAPYDVFEGTLGLRFGGRTVSGGVEAEGFTELYTLYGARPSSSAVGIHPQPERRNRHLAGTLWFGAQLAPGTDLSLSGTLGSTGLNTEVFVDDDTDENSFDSELTEKRLDLSGQLETRMGSGEGRLGVDFMTSGLDADTFLGSNVVSADYSAAYSFVHDGQFSITVGANLMQLMADRVDEDVPPGSVAVGDTVRDSQLWVSPALGLDWAPRQYFRVYVANKPGIWRRSLSDLLQTNPYLTFRPAVEPTIAVVNAEAGFELTAGRARLGAFAGYQQFPRYQFFEHVGPSESMGYQYGISSVQYAEADIVFAGASVSLVLPAGLQASVTGKYRDGQLTEFESVIPYFGPITANAMISWATPGGRGLIQAVMDYESGRYRDRQETRKIGDYFDLDLRGSYFFTPTIGVTAAVENISAGYLERWDNYPVAPTVFTVGLGVRL